MCPFTLAAILPSTAGCVLKKQATGHNGKGAYDAFNSLVQPPVQFAAFIVLGVHSSYWRTDLQAYKSSYWRTDLQA